MNRRAVVLNDCSGRGGHIGSVLVMEALTDLARSAGIEIVRRYPLGYGRWDGSYDRIVDASGLVLVNGEGTFHHDAVNAVRLVAAAARAKSRGAQVVLLNTVWQANPTLGRELRNFDLVFVRESRSAAELRRLGCEPAVVPDLSLRTVPSAWPALEAGTPVVTDSVSVPLSLELAEYAVQQRYRFAPMGTWLRTFGTRYPRQTLRLLTRSPRALPALRAIRRQELGIFATAPCVLTGRFHGVCLALVGGAPFVAWPSNTWKIEGLAEDAGMASQVMAAGTEVKLWKAALGAAGLDRTRFATIASDYLGRARAGSRRMIEIIADLP